MALSEAEMEALLDRLDQGVLMYDPAGRLLFANGAARRALGADGGRVSDLRAAALSRGAREVNLSGNGGRAAVGIILPLARGSSTLAEQERNAILQALEVTHGKLAETARRLGISRTTLWRRLKAYGAVPPAPASR